jgi:flagellin
MSFRINTNVSAMGALRNLNSTSMDLNKSVQRLSTGLRINSGADDPAGLIASESFRAQLGGIDAAVRNNQDALNFAKTADGALDEVSRLLRDARALAVANGNGTYDADQKQANQSQLNSILSSIDRIASTTSFGKKKLLDGSAGAQVNSNNLSVVTSASVTGSIGGTSLSANGTLGVNVTTAAGRATLTGTAAYTAGTVLVGAGQFTLNGKTFETTASTTRDQLVDMVNGAVGETGVSATVNGSNNIVLTNTEYGSDKNVQLTTTAGVVNSAAGSASDAGEDAVATVSYTVGGATTTAAFSRGKGLELRDTSGNVVNLNASANSVSDKGNVLQVFSNAASFQVGANAGQSVTLNLANTSASSLGLGSVDITGSSVQSALDAIDSAINTVSTNRATIGSFMKNTLESNVRALGVAKENLAATESSIREVDVAQEMTNYTKLQILQQSGLSMLAQANSAPQSILSLLR